VCRLPAKCVLPGDSPLILRGILPLRRRLKPPE
jgi:hypothetical protein